MLYLSEFDFRYNARDTFDGERADLGGGFEERG
jgi:hypothetical protein